MRPILVPVDLADNSEMVVNYAARLARGTHGSLIIMHALPPTILPGADDDDVYDPQQDAKKETLHSIVPSVSGVPYEHYLTHGAAVEAILAAAEKKHARLIVIGARGRAAHEGDPLGPIAKQVVLQSPCPVMLVSSRANTDAKPAAS